MPEVREGGERRGAKRTVSGLAYVTYYLEYAHTSRELPAYSENWLGSIECAGAARLPVIIPLLLLPSFLLSLSLSLSRVVSSQFSNGRPRKRRTRSLEIKICISDRYIYIYTGLVIIDDNSLLHPGKRAAQSFGETLLAKLSPFPLLREEREREIEFGFDIGDN